jgi:hypothetical protein
MTHPQDPSHRESRVHRLDQLARDIPPARDLWPSVEAGLTELHPRAAPRYRSRRWLPWTAFATMAAVAGVVVVVLPPRDMPLPTQEVASSAEANYEAERAALAAQMPARVAELPAEARRDVTAGLDAIRLAEAEVQAAIVQDAGDPLLLEMLIAVRQEEMRVMTNLRDNQDEERLL